MGFFRAPVRIDGKPRRRSRLGLLLFLTVVYAAMRFAGHPSFHLLHPPGRTTFPRPPPILPIADPDEMPGDLQIYHFTGRRVRGNGTNLDLGDRRTHLPASLISRFFPDEFRAPSCLTQPTPALPTPGAVPPKPLPVRADWPGFFGAPWTAWADGDLIALLHVNAPRNSNLAVPAPIVQLYANYAASPLPSPSFATSAPAVFERGSKAVLYRVFPNGPVRCLDLVVQNGENNGVGHLYYLKYHHYYEMDTIFKIQP
jgi:hypothetical protein